MGNVDIATRWFHYSNLIGGHACKVLNYRDLDKTQVECRNCDIFIDITRVHPRQIDAIIVEVFGATECAGRLAMPIANTPWFAYPTSHEYPVKRKSSVPL